jgi:hypothetical protein
MENNARYSAVLISLAVPNVYDEGNHLERVLTG